MLLIWEKIDKKKFFEVKKRLIDFFINDLSPLFDYLLQIFKIVSSNIKIICVNQVK